MAVLCLSWHLTSAQAYRQLTADDFGGRPQRNSGTIAYTNCSIDFKYQAYHKRDYYQLYFTIRLMVNRDRSWMDKERINSAGMLAEVLKHEQGHYIIAYLEQQELLREVGHTRFGADYQYRAKTQSFNQDFSRVLFNASIAKTFLKEENLKFTLGGNDLLNQNTGFSRMANGNLLTQTSNTTIRRYLMFSVSWDFNKMGGK